MCPCHGGVYYEDGYGRRRARRRTASARYPVRVEGDDVQVRAEPVPIG